MALEEKVMGILAQVSGKDATDINAEMELVSHLGIDSPKVLELLVSLEEGLDIEIEDEDAAKMDTVGDILSYLKGRGLESA